MTAILILGGAIVAVGAVLYIHHRLSGAGGYEMPAAPAEDTAAGSGSDECCGMHITCPKDSLLAAVSEKIEYYDDEELDRFAGRPADAYVDEEADEFRDVMLTMKPEEIAGWARSLQLRGITLPADVRDELLLIVAEERRRKSGV